MVPGGLSTSSPSIKTKKTDNSTAPTIIVRIAMAYIIGFQFHWVVPKAT